MNRFLFHFISYANTHKAQLSILGIALFYFLFLPIDIMDIDAAQYASIAREMTENGSYLQVYQREADYLDKPPLLFWLASLSFTLFGFTNAAFKLPAVLIILLGIYSTYKASRLFYSEKISLTAMLILASSQAYFLMANDVRTDGILSGFTIFATWQLLRFSIKQNFQTLALGATGIALAMLSKGPIGAIIPLAAVIPHLILTRNFKALFNPLWLLLPIIVLLLLSPMLYGLYQQFDLHPEKKVYGLDGPSGIKFFFWTQSFGRITGDIYWKDDSGPLFFLQSMAWDMQPWFILSLAAVLISLYFTGKSLIQHKTIHEAWSLCGFLLPFIALSSSQFKLPHYVFPLFSFLSVQIALLFFERFTQLPRLLQKTLFFFQCIPLFAFPVLTALIFLFVFTPDPIFVTLFYLLLACILYLVYKLYKKPLDRLVYANIGVAMWCSLFLSLHFYPHLLRYQGSAQAGKWVSRENIAQDQFYTVDVHSFSLEFYARRMVPYTPFDQLHTLPANTYILLSEEAKNKLMQNYPSAFDIVKKYDQYSVTILKKEFLLKESRANQLKSIFILKKRNEN